MHLGFIHGPFVPPYLISAQDSPVPLPNFQMVPRLKILMSFGSKKGTQIYFPLLSKKSRPVDPIQVPKTASNTKINMTYTDEYKQTDMVK